MQTRITGWGHRLPKKKVANDDPVYSQIDKSNDIFFGYKTRCRLSGEETVEDLMAEAASQALEKAGISAKELDYIVGYGTIGKYQAPNLLGLVHQKLGMDSHSTIMTIASEFNNYLQGITVADALIGAGRARHVLVVVGHNYSHHFRKDDPAFFSIGDGMGACVLSATNKKGFFRLIDTAAHSASSFHSGMSFVGDNNCPDDPQKDSYKTPRFLMNDLGVEGFHAVGLDLPPQLVEDLLQKNGLNTQDVCLVCYQASNSLLKHWEERLKPGQLIHSLEENGNMAVATVAVNFSAQYDKIDKDYVVMLSLGLDMQVQALLLKRD